MLTGRRNRGTMGTVVERFAAGLGTPNLVTYDPFDPAPIRKAMELTTGVSRLPAVDFANANFLLSFNANLFETFLSPVRNIYSYGHMRQGRPGIRGGFVHAEPRLSQTAACADQWLPIKPGTEGLLALAIAHVIVSEKLYDADFVGQNTGRICRMVRIAGRIRARDNRSADRCAGARDPTCRARVRAPGGQASPSATAATSRH